MEWNDDGIILSAKRHGETSAIVRVFTTNHGVHAGLIRGGFSKRLRATIEPGNRVSATWRGRLAEHLGSFTLEVIHAHGAELMANADGLITLAAATSIVESSLPEREPHAACFDALSTLFTALENPQIGEHPLAWGSLYVKWELGILSELGFGLDLSHCAATGTLEDLIWVSPKSARAVSAAAGQPYKEKLLPLAAFLKTEGASAETLEELLKGLKLTGYFIERHLFATHDQHIPPARSRLIERLAHLSAG